MYFLVFAIIVTIFSYSEHLKDNFSVKLFVRENLSNMFVFSFLIVFGCLATKEYNKDRAKSIISIGIGVGN